MAMILFLASQSTKLEWEGDDHGDGKLLQQHEKYLCCVQLVKSIVSNLTDVHQQSLIISDLNKIQELLGDDLSFTFTGL